MATSAAEVLGTLGVSDVELSEQEEILWALEENAPRYNDWLLSRALPHVGTHVLEVGAGIGTFTLLLAALGVRVTALEPEERLAAVLKKRTRRLDGVKVISADITGFDPELLAEPVDAVICFNVLEHIARDDAAIDRMGRCLNRSGHLMVLAPAHRLLFGATDEAVEHQRRYSARGLRRLIGQAGLELVDLNHVNPVGALGWFASSCLLRRRTLSVSSLRIYERLVPTLRQLDRVPFPIGLSLWARATLPA
jgi:SAM-dependent methyltransferase